MVSGDRLVIASTDYDLEQAEKVEVVVCDDCSAQEVRVDGKGNALPYFIF